MDDTNINSIQSDEHDILNDQDETKKQYLTVDDENMGAKSKSLDTLENEPEAFITGEVDLCTQMDRSIYDILDEDNHEEELQATFENTPGGLEEVEMKTDRELARRHSHSHHTF